MPETGFSEQTDKFYMKEKIQKVINKIKNIFLILVSKMKAGKKPPEDASSGKEDAALKAKKAEAKENGSEDKAASEEAKKTGTSESSSAEKNREKAEIPEDFVPGKNKEKAPDSEASAEKAGKKDENIPSENKASGFWGKLKGAAVKTVRAIIIAYRKVKKFFKKVKRTYQKKKLPILITTLAVLIVILVFVLLVGPQEEEVTVTKYQEWMKQLRSKDIVVCQVDTINDFFDDYYEALSEGNTTALEKLYDDPLSANITTELSSIVESYTDLTVYVTPGINSGEVAVFVHYYINFVNIESAAPAVDSFYIMMDSENSSVYILTSMYTDADINTFLYLASYRNPVRTLLSDTEDELNAILEEDSELRNIYIIMNAMAEEGSSEEETSETSVSDTSEESFEEETEGESETQ